MHIKAKTLPFSMLKTAVDVTLKDSVAASLLVASSSLAPVLLFISFVEFYKCNFGANVNYRF